MAESNSFKHTLMVRALSGTALVAVMLTMLYLGGWWWHGFAAFIALGSLWEFCRMAPGVPRADVFAAFVTAAIVLFSSEHVSQAGLMAIFGLCCFFAYFVELARRQITADSHSNASVGPVMTGLIYTIVPWYCMIRFRALPDPVGWAAVLSIFLCTWSCDVAAYLVGSRWGTLRICPHISPNKSLEGFVGGFFASTLCGALCAWYFGFSPWAFVLTGAACGSAGQLGDLVESLIKRENGVKDSGHILPGHGGFLDRFDSVLVNSLCAWLIWRVCLL